MRKFFDELKSNLDVETVAAEAAAAIAEQDSTATKLSDDDLSQIAGEDFLWEKYLATTTTQIVCFVFVSSYSHLCFFWVFCLQMEV